MLLFSVINGRERSVWFSASADLEQDARRDFTDIGAAYMPLLSLKDVKYDEDIDNHKRPFTCGVLFCTYSTLIGVKAGPPTVTRIEQLITWMKGGKGGGMGCIVFDECHKVFFGPFWIIGYLFIQLNFF